MTVASYLDTHKAIIGTSGAGKSTTAREEVEQLLRDNRHICIIDPTGVWWGLRSAADGDGPGYDIPVFGGDHGDIPISADQGDVVGRIVASGISAVVDVSDMDGAGQRLFVLEMLKALRKHRPRGNFHLVVDEADEFAAQTSRDSVGFQCEEALVWTAKRGRFYGYVLTIITQRTADMSWSVLSQCVTMIVHHLMAPQDIAVVDKYLKAHADKETRTKVLASVPNLQTGERWIYSPKMKLLEFGITPLPTTFDSSATPAPGEAVTEPKMLAQIDIGSIRKMLAPPEREAPMPEYREAPENEEMITLRANLRDAVSERDAAQRDAKRFRALADARKRQVDRILLIAAEKLIGEEDELETLEIQSYGSIPVPTLETGIGKMPAETKKIPVKRSTEIPEGIEPRWQKILDAIAWAETLLKMEAVDRAVIGWAAGKSPNGGGFQNDLGAMRSRGLISYPREGTAALTETGRAFAQMPDMPPPPQQMQQMVKAALDLKRQSIFDALKLFVSKQDLYNLIKSCLEQRHQDILDAVRGYVRASRETIAGHIGKSAAGGGFQNDLGRLRTLGLIDYPEAGYVELGPVLR